MTNDSKDVDDAIEQYRRTCSIIFGRTSSSQLRYLQSSIDVQQSLLTSCDSTIAKQIAWLEDFAKKKNNNKSMNWLVSILEPFLRSYSAAVKASMALISISYDIASNQLESYKKMVDITNKSYFS
ncbi:MAG: hypothetical protein WBW34_11835 [Nitrososphaeraceae archaeon]